MLPGPATDLILIDFDNKEVSFYIYVVEVVFS